ncbi:MAG: 4-(cytidine 5'-diphospho)-2-C-methyl-D-erythritol kinase [Bifidobacteriaceae bacterium]|jgi:4-diphosphocytidyl-2-C-methyl-D-erythritol kinase|nr:4-(cytidine 5'-diphospho)-2-C-methyl-D-erythritol kinase [Bifidobacteriaceae bacterium]
MVASDGTRGGGRRQNAGGPVVATAPAKINLALRVGPRRADGYHPLNSLFHAVDLVERVTVGPALAGGDELSVSGRGAGSVPLDQTNLVWRAAALARREGGRRGDPVRLRIDKAIPVAGGLAGGSADAAAALVALNRFWGLGLAGARLIELAAELGSDVPFAVLGGNAIGQGRGETLRPLAAAAPGTAGALEWVLVTSGEGMSTPAVFAHFDALGLAAGRSEPPPIPPGLLAGLAAGDPSLVGANLVNDLQPAALDLRPDLGHVIGQALAAGAVGAVVSGSGPTLACLAESAPAADALARDLAARLAGTHPPGSILRAAGPAPGAAIA